MRIVFDLDGVICELKKPSESYSEVKPKKKVIQKMRDLKEEGHYLIIHTGRHMRTCEGDVTKVIEKIGKVTEDWLEKWKVPYDELVFGKPYADVYIDDLGYEFSSSKKLGEKLEQIQPIIIIPMAGEGKRFKNEGIKKPKFMIEVKNKSLFDFTLNTYFLTDTKHMLITYQYLYIFSPFPKRLSLSKDLKLENRDFFLLV